MYINTYVYTVKYLNIHPNPITPHSHAYLTLNLISIQQVNKYPTPYPHHPHPYTPTPPTCPHAYLTLNLISIQQVNKYPPTYPPMPTLHLIWSVSNRLMSISRPPTSLMAS